jgi:hypothetical protein
VIFLIEMEVEEEEEVVAEWDDKKVAYAKEPIIPTLWKKRTWLEILLMKSSRWVE